MLAHSPDWVLYNEFVLTKKNYIRTLTELKGYYLFEVNPEYFNPKKINNIDTKRELEKIERDYIEKKS